MNTGPKSKKLRSELMNRRRFLELSGHLTGQLVLAAAGIQAVKMVSASGDEIPLAGLQTSLDPEDGIILVPETALYDQYSSAFNKRTLKFPKVRVLCATPRGVAICIQWARANRIELAMRSGGHSFEGLSQTKGLAIDTRLMNEIQLSVGNDTFTSGAGSALGEVYEILAAKGRTVPAGSCPSVGITGHTLGGGYGLVARAFGLACDNLISVQIVTADSRILTCSPTQNPDLFWALRGGGGGSFGVVTKLEYRTHQVDKVNVFSVGWSLNAHVASQLIQAWQSWAPLAPREITSLLRVSRNQNGLFFLKAIGQTVGSEQQLRQELKKLTNVVSATVNLTNLPFIGAVQHFGGSFDQAPVFMKGKSDYIKAEMTNDGVKHFLSLMPLGVDVIFDSYGGAIRDIRDDDTAFAHRAGVLSSLQYYTEWADASQSAGRLAVMKDFHDQMRPIMSGAAYFNYCDLDIQNYAVAYWGANLPKLVQIKEKYDSANFFRHAQSVPVRLA